MDLQGILRIIEMATSLAQIAASGTRAAGDVQTIAALEQLTATVIALHEAESGQPMDLSKFTPKTHIDG